MQEKSEVTIMTNNVTEQANASRSAPGSNTTVSDHAILRFSTKPVVRIVMEKPMRF